MPKFETPRPIAITITDVFLGDVKIIASDRTDTVVEVRPSNADKKNDTRAAQETEVDFTGDFLTVKAPAWWTKMNTIFGANPSIDVTIEVPTGSRLHGTGHACRFLVTGELGQCELKSHAGGIQLDRVGPLKLQTSVGNVTVDQVMGGASITTNGIVRVREINGSAVVKNTHGDTTIREVADDLRVNAANGNITVERPGGSVTAKTASGSIRVGDATRGTLRLETATGELEVGIHPGSAAYLDVHTKIGAIQNLMESVDQPARGEETVHVYARNSLGNITIRHATAI
jgi:DUF4097 and DUF4098 domain-containing protein YvlB